MRRVAAFVLLLGLACIWLFAPASAADKFPSKPIRWVVGFAAGGPNDIVARFMGEWLSSHLGQQIIIENRVGSGGMIAAQAVINSPPDGYIFAFAIDQGDCKTDPTIGIKTTKPPKSSGYLTWGEVQIEQYRERHEIGTMARLALELMLNIAARRHDAHQIGRQHLRNGCLSWRPSKTSQSTGKMLTIRVMPELQAALDAMPHSDALTFLLTEHGRPFKSAAAFGNNFADWCKAAGLKPTLCDDGKMRNYRAHGLRKAACMQLAHAGCTAPEIMAVSGHATLTEAQMYIVAVEQERMAEAAMVKRAAGSKRAQMVTNVENEG